MAKWLTVAELSSELGISQRAVRKQIEEGKWTAKKRGNKWLINTEESTVSDTINVNELRAEVEKLQAVLLERENLVEQLKSENEHLQTRLDEALQDARMKSERSDMIILKLTIQMEQHKLMIENMRQRKNIWQRVRTRLRHLINLDAVGEIRFKQFKRTE
ncbi:MAG: helix-turn-helix domain-containing protein [Candidatus Poribacteria bacterium]